MIPPFDIFLVDSYDGQLVRKGTVETLDVARLRIKILMASPFMASPKARSSPESALFLALRNHIVL